MSIGPIITFAQQPQICSAFARLWPLPPFFSILFNLLLSPFKTQGIRGPLTVEPLFEILIFRRNCAMFSFGAVRLIYLPIFNRYEKYP